MLKLVSNIVNSGFACGGVGELPHLASSVIRSQVSVVIELIAVSQSVRNNTSMFIYGRKPYTVLLFFIADILCFHISPDYIFILYI